MLIPPMRDLGFDNLVPPGTYHLCIHKVMFNETPKKAGASPYFGMWHKIVAPDDVYLGQMIFANYPIAGGGSYRLRDLLQVTGHAEDFQLDTEDTSGLIGREFRAVVEIERDLTYGDKAVIRKHLPLY